MTEKHQNSQKLLTYQERIRQKLGFLFGIFPKFKILLRKNLLVYCSFISSWCRQRFGLMKTRYSSQAGAADPVVNLWVLHYITGITAD